MPFTFSHPGIVLPFAKSRFFSASGLVIGSLAPDFEYFFKLSKGATSFSHTWPSLFYFNLPVGILLFVLFHAAVRQPLVQHLPQGLYNRFYPISMLDWKKVVRQKWHLLMLSILMGSSSHLLWDKLTHASADYSYHHQHQLFFFAEWKHHSFIYFWVHLAHSLIGLLLICWTVYRLPAQAVVKPRVNIWKFWLLTTTGCALLFFLSLWLLTPWAWDDLAVRLLAFFLLALAVVSIFFRAPSYHRKA